MHASTLLVACIFFFLQLNCRGETRAGTSRALQWGNDVYAGSCNGLTSNPPTKRKCCNGGCCGLAEICKSSSYCCKGGSPGCPAADDCSFGEVFNGVFNQWGVWIIFGILFGVLCLFGLFSLLGDALRKLAGLHRRPLGARETADSVAADQNPLDHLPPEVREALRAFHETSDSADGKAVSGAVPQSINAPLPAPVDTTANPLGFRKPPPQWAVPPPLLPPSAPPPGPPPGPRR